MKRYSLSESTRFVSRDLLDIMVDYAWVCQSRLHPRHHKAREMEKFFHHGCRILRKLGRMEEGHHLESLLRRDLRILLMALLGYRQNCIHDRREDYSALISDYDAAISEILGELNLSKPRLETWSRRPGMLSAYLRYSVATANEG